LFAELAPQFFQLPGGLALAIFDAPLYGSLELFDAPLRGAVDVVKGAFDVVQAVLDQRAYLLQLMTVDIWRFLAWAALALPRPLGWMRHQFLLLPKQFTR
jgi:hypothetical protein